MATNKIHSTNAFAERVKSLGLTYVELAKFSGYSLSAIYNVSSIVGGRQYLADNPGRQRQITQIK